MNPTMQKVPRENKIRHLSWTEFVARLADCQTIIIPTGAVEIYGPHLPMGSDGIVADRISELLAAKINALIAPRIDLSDSSMLLDLPGTFTVSKELFTTWIAELVDQLINYGFKNFLFITGHAASVDPINHVARKRQIEDGIRYAQVDWWRFTAANDAGIFDEVGRMAHGHASECGTSVMLYLAPELVDMNKAVRVEPDPSLYTYPDIIRFTPISLKSDNSIVGDAQKASAEKGRQIVERCVQRILDFLVSEWNLSILEED